VAVSLSVVKHSDPASFRDAALVRLMEAEPENCRLIAWTIRYVQSVRGDEPQPRMWTVQDRGDIEMVAIQRPGDLFEVSRGSKRAADCLADALAEEGNVDAIVGVRPSIQIIVDRFTQLTGRKPNLLRRFSGHETSQVIAPPTTGSMRICGAEDRQVLSDFLRAYVIAINEPAEDLPKLVDELIAGQRIYLWCDPNPVAMAGWAGPTPNGIRINSVFTPSEFRNRGYASNLIAQLTQKLLDDGRRSVFLFTDQRNPSAERIYETIGYRRVSDGEHWTFD
jgi:predicted GNAT family acetyltransferase